MHPPRPESLSAASGLMTLLERQLADDQLDLPMLSEVAAQTMEMCEDDDCDPRKLAELVQRDVTLSGNVLRLANSVMFAARESIVSVQQAIWRIGTATLKSIALTTAVQSRIFNVPGHEMRLKQLWSHSTLAGGWAREIARARRKNVEGAFLCGMLHDVGKPIVLQEAVSTAQAARTALSPELREACMQALHGPVGARLVAGWGLPEWMGVSCAYHHEPERAPTHAEFAWTARAADLLAHWSVDATREEAGKEQLLHEGVFAELGFYADDLEGLLGQHENVVKTAEALT